MQCGNAGGQGQQLRSMLALMRWLQLYMLADPAATQPDVAADLQGVFTGAFTKVKPVAGKVQPTRCIVADGCLMHKLVTCLEIQYGCSIPDIILLLHAFQPVFSYMLVSNSAPDVGSWSPNRGPSKVWISSCLVKLWQQWFSLATHCCSD